MKCKLDSIVSGLGDTLEFEDIFENTGRIFIVRSNFGHAGYPVKPFQKGIVVSFLRSFASLLTSLSSSFASALASSDKSVSKGLMSRVCLSCCVVAQNGMHNLYDKSIPDKSTGGNLLYWAVSTYKEGWDEVYGFVVSGMHHCCHVALKLVESKLDLKVGIASWVFGSA